MNVTRTCHLIVLIMTAFHPRFQREGKGEGENRLNRFIHYESYLTCTIIETEEFNTRCLHLSNRSGLCRADAAFRLIQ